MPKTTPAAAKSRPARKAAPTKAKASPKPLASPAQAAPAPAHEHVVLTGPFETHQGGSRIFRAGPRSLPPHLAAEARAKGLVAPTETE